MLAGLGISGQDHDGALCLLRAEDGARRVVWECSEVVVAGQWATRYARAQSVDSVGGIMLL